jgi:hypothetical protein
MELCGEHVITVIAGASWISCALDKGHEGGHRGKGNCFRHGQYFGDVGAFPQCPQWPTCSQNLTADELKRNYPEPKESPELAQAVATGEPDCTCGADKGMDWGCHAMECPVHQYHLNYPTAARRLVESWKSPAQESETVDSIQLRISMRELKATRDINAQLRSQLRNWETWGTVEIAIRNPNVDSYMKHWEGRALAAEEKVAELKGRIANALL